MANPPKDEKKQPMPQTAEEVLAAYNRRLAIQRWGMENTVCGVKGCLGRIGVACTGQHEGMPFHTTRQKAAELGYAWLQKYGRRSASA